MRLNIRSVGLASVSVAGAVLMAFSGSATAMAADKAVMIGGIDVGTLPPLFIPLIQGGAYKNYDVTNAVWPAEAAPYTGKGDLTLGASIAIGVPSLQAAVTQALAAATGDETVTIVGMSAGSLVVDELLRQWETTGTGPDPSKVNIVVMADSSRQANIKGQQYSKQYDYTYQIPVDTPYNTTVVTKEYDGASDFPDRPFNLLAVMNAVAGAVLLHDTTFFVDLSTVPAEDITVSAPNSLGGVTTHYLIPTDTLPLVMLNPRLAPREAQLKAKIDKGYSRNDAPATTAATTTLAAATTTVAATTDTAVATPKVKALRLKTKAATAATVTDATASTNGATDLSDGNATTPTTVASTTSSKKAWKPGDGTLKRVISKLLGGKKESATGTSSATDSSSSSSASTSSSAAA